MTVCMSVCVCVCVYVLSHAGFCFLFPRALFFFFMFPSFIYHCDDDFCLFICEFSDVTISYWLRKAFYDIDMILMIILYYPPVLYPFYVLIAHHLHLPLI